MLNLFLTAALVSASVTGPMKSVMTQVKGEATDAEYQQLSKALTCSPTLNKFVTKLAKSRQMSAIHIVPADKAVRQGDLKYRGWQDGGMIRFTSDFLSELANPEHRFHTLSYANNNPNDLTFALGFLAGHLANAQKTRAAEDQTKEDMESVSREAQKSGGFADMTQIFKTSLDSSFDNDAQAWMLGYNAMIECAKAAKGSALSVEEVAQLSLKSRYGSIISGAWTNNVVTTQDGKIPDFPQNRATFARSLRSARVQDIR
jgi:hypothetical protein